MLCSMVEAATAATLPHLPPLAQTRHWHAELAEVWDAAKRLESAQKAEAGSMWLRTARAFRNAFGQQGPHGSVGFSRGGNGGNQLTGVQGDEAVRYVGELSGQRAKEYRFALNPHVSGFESSWRHDVADGAAAARKHLPLQQPLQHAGNKHRRDNKREEGSDQEV